MPTTDYVALAQQLAAQGQAGQYGQPQQLNVTGNMNQQANPLYAGTATAPQQGGMNPLMTAAMLGGGAWAAKKYGGNLLARGAGAASKLASPFWQNAVTPVAEVLGSPAMPGVGGINIPASAAIQGVRPGFQIAGGLPGMAASSAGPAISPVPATVTRYAAIGGVPAGEAISIPGVAAMDAVEPVAGVAGRQAGLTTLGKVAAPLAGLTTGLQAQQMLNERDFGGEGSKLDRGLSGFGVGAGVGAGIGSIVPGVGTLVGAGVGALIGGIAGAVSMIEWGDDEKELKARVDNASTKMDKRLDQIAAKNDIQPQITDQIRSQVLDALSEIRALKNDPDTGERIGADEKVKMFEAVSDAAAQALKDAKGTGSAARLAAEEAASQKAMQENYARAQLESESARTIALQGFMADVMRPYADKLSPEMGAAYMAQAQASPIIMAMERQAQVAQSQMSQGEYENQTMNAQANMLRAQADWARAQNGTGSSDGTPNLEDAIGTGATR